MAQRKRKFRGWLKGLFTKPRSIEEPEPEGPVLDPDVESVLEQLDILEYTEILAAEQVKYEELPELISHLDELNIDPDAKAKLVSYVERNFVATDCLIDSSRITSVGAEIARGAFGAIRVGKVSAGIAELSVAIKEIHLDGKTTNRDKVLCEVRIMERLRHRFILKCFGCYFSDLGDVAYIVLEYCSLGDLKKYREAHPDLSWQSKIGFLLKICKAMQYVHDKGFVHYDLKVQNILLSDEISGSGSSFGFASSPSGGSEHEIRICDFGEACRRGTCENHLIGTPAYLAPEQCRGNRIPPEQEHLVDIYAFGFLCYELWTGKVPFEGMSAQYPKLASFIQAVHGGPQPLRPNLDEMVGATDALKQIIMDCWAADPAERLESFEAIAQDMIMAKTDFARDLVSEEARRQKKQGLGGDGNAAGGLDTNVRDPSPRGLPEMSHYYPGQGGATPNPFTTPYEADPAAASYEADSACELASAVTYRAAPASFQADPATAASYAVDPSVAASYAVDPAAAAHYYPPSTGQAYPTDPPLASIGEPYPVDPSSPYPTDPTAGQQYPSTGQDYSTDPSTGQAYSTDPSGQAYSTDPSTGQPYAGQQYVDPSTGQPYPAEGYAAQGYDTAEAEAEAYQQYQEQYYAQYHQAQAQSGDQ